MRLFDIDGTQVAAHVEEAADTVRDIILVHGAGSDHSAWRFQTRYLAARGYRVLAPDLPGHGRSEGPAQATIPDLAAWLLRFIDVVESRSPIVIGHSMGSLVALHAAASRPDAIADLVLIATSERMRVHPELLSAAADKDDHAIQLMIGWIHTGEQRYGGHQSPGTWSAGSTRRLLEREIDVLHGDLLACDTYDTLTTAASVTARTLVISGETDHMTSSRSGAALCEAILDCEFVQVPGAGHEMMFEQSARVNAAILRHLGGRVPSR